MQKVGQKRGQTVSMADLNWMEFDGIHYNEDANEYHAKVSLKKEIRKGFTFRGKHVVLDNTMLNHWSQYLSIGIMVNSYPDLMDAYFFVVDHRTTYIEPCFADIPVDFHIKLLSTKRKTKKDEISFLHVLGKGQAIYRVDFVIVKEEKDIMKYYHKKHSQS